MTKRILSLVLVFIMIASMLVACKPSNPEEPIGTQPTTEQTDPTTQPTTPEVTEPSKPVGPDKPIGEYDTLSAEDMAAYVVDRAYEYKKQNTMYSPLSFNMAVALVAEGADEDKADLFKALLDKEDYTQYVKEYNEYLKELNVDNSDSNFNKYKTVFNIANSLWVDQKYELIEDYLNAVEPFDAEVDKIDIEDKEGSSNKINKWCAEKTFDLIKEIITPENITPATSMIAVNAVYFESPWANEWNVKNNTEMFTNIDGNEIEHNPMINYLDKYYENDKATAFGCDYKNGLTFIGILPKNEGEFSVQDLDLKSLIESETSKYDVVAKMPKFKFDNKISNLKQILIDLGYGELFDPERGIFHNILKDENGNIELTVSDIIQADAIELDENGTKAAAVTAVIMDATSSIPEPKETKEITLDRPFAFIIYDNEMDQIVFVGKVVTIG